MLLINDFNRASFDVATRRGARIVKTIGDAVMFVATDAATVANAALDLVAYFAHHEVFTAARAGAATGDVLEQDGDCYGPVVNRYSDRPQKSTVRSASKSWTRNIYI